MERKKRAVRLFQETRAIIIYNQGRLNSEALFYQVNQKTRKKKLLFEVDFLCPIRPSSDVTFKS